MADAQKSEARRGHPARDPPDVRADDREGGDAKRADERPRQPRHQPPRTVGAHHSDHEPEVSGRDAVQQCHPLERIRPLHIGGELVQASANTLCVSIMVILLAIRRITGERTDSFDHRLHQPPVGLLEAERRKRHECGTMRSARVRHHRTARNPQRKLGHVDDQVPVLVEQSRASGVDDLGQRRRRGHQRVAYGGDLPVHIRVAHRELALNIGGELLHRLGLEQGRDDEAESDGRPTFLARLAGSGSDIAVADSHRVVLPPGVWPRSSAASSTVRSEQTIHAASTMTGSSCWLWRKYTAFRTVWIVAPLGRNRPTKR